ncbi:uncharacterized protein isoform X4 [Rhodnius prolixus]|uniref:Uncharacterized protein n=1 Tax=Rhodnius prolixus TaxID=13249 RepID=T1IDW6_RHOPR
MIAILKYILCIECFLTIVATTAKASDEISSSPILNPAFVRDPNEDRQIVFIPLGNDQDKSATNIVRRNDFFYAKNLKTVPRIGRRNGFTATLAADGRSGARVDRRDEFHEMDKDRLWPWPKAGKYIPIVVKKKSGYFHGDSSADHS